ncbi:nuclear transport factor 2 family protein [Pararcticibacter amylolyticus]|uniref:DUF4878 domain-containing protein n=1 Tax=Pararcticibacter amylolyticus TaxID=2173175 RepID=A0A2U2PGA4_9SPHI|nr:nuclear transport factor 2 family protein [Pararcticibacter amylolyticus]PWG80431.1 hypothetical protein DDR33_12575 [Pararcticibacter amylolyticus]
MKKLASLIAAICLVFSLSSFVKDESTKDLKLTMDYAIKTYVDAISLGKVKPLAEVLDSDVKYTVTHGEKIMNFNRSEMLDQLKASENLRQNCDVKYSLVEQNTSQAIYKVVFTYDTFARTNYVTIAQTKKGWKLTSISSAFN